MNSFQQIRYLIHIHIKNFTALYTSYMVMIFQCKIKSVRSIRNLNLS